MGLDQKVKKKKIVSFQTGQSAVLKIRLRKNGDIWVLANTSEDCNLKIVNGKTYST